MKKDNNQASSQYLWVIGVILVFAQMFMGAWMQHVQSDVAELRVKADRVLAIEALQAAEVKQIDRLNDSVGKILERMRK